MAQTQPLFAEPAALETPRYTFAAQTARRAMDSLDGDEDDLRGGFPFRLLAAGYGLGLILSITMVGAGFGVLTAAAAGWFGGVAAMIALPFASHALQGFLSGVQSRARDAAHREASLEAWDLDLEDDIEFAGLAAGRAR